MYVDVVDLPWHGLDVQETFCLCCVLPCCALCRRRDMKLLRLHRSDAYIEHHIAYIFWTPLLHTSLRDVSIRFWFSCPRNFKSTPIFSRLFSKILKSWSFCSQMHTYEFFSFFYLAIANTRGFFEYVLYMTEL